MLAKRSAQVFPRCRRRSRKGPVLPVLSLAVGLLAGLVVGAAALGATPAGPQFQINTYTTGRQVSPSVASDADGNFVVVWQSAGSAGGGGWSYSVHGQRYDAGGNALASEFQINTYTTGSQFTPSVAANADGDFVVVWSSRESPGDDTSLGSVQAQRYDASGTALGSQFQVNTYTTGTQRWPSVAIDGDGDFVVVWTSDGSAGSDSSSYSVQGQRYDANGNAAGSEFQVNTYTPNKQMNPSVAVRADGNFVVVWESFGNASFPYFAIQSQRYDASGNAVGAEFQVDTSIHLVVEPSVATHADGDFVVAWSAYNYTSPYSYLDIASQRYDANGNAVGSLFWVNPATADQNDPSVGLDADGDFIIVWQSGTDILGRGYDASGSPIGAEFLVNPTAPHNVQRNPEVTVDADGDFVVVWQSYKWSPGNDTDDSSIQGRRYTLQAPEVPSLSPPGVLGLGLLLFGITAVALRRRFPKRARAGPTHGPSSSA